MSGKAINPLNGFNIFFQKWKMYGKALGLYVASHTVQETFEVMKNIFHMSKDYHPGASSNQSIPSLPQAAGEEEEEDEASRMLGAAEQNTSDHPGGDEGYE